MTVRDLNYDNFGQLVNFDRTSIIKLWHAGCDMCITLKPIYEKVAEMYQDYFDFYEVNTTEDSYKLSGWLRKKSLGPAGVPEIYFYCAGNYKEIPWPESPTESGYSEEYLINFINHHEWYRSFSEDNS